MEAVLTTNSLNPGINDKAIGYGLNPNLPPHSHNGIDSPLLDKAANGLGSSTGLIGRIYLTAAQNVNDTTDTKILLDTSGLSSGVTIDTANSRVKVTTAGYYYVHGQITFAVTVASKGFAAELYKNGSGTQSMYSRVHTVDTSVASAQVSGLLNLALNDYIELFAFHNFGAAKALQTGSQYTYLEIYKV